MPITGASSYLPTTDLFLAHWTLVNPVAQPPPMLLDGGRTVGLLQGLRNSLAAARTDVEVKRNGWEIARTDIVLGRAALLARTEQVFHNIHAFWGKTKFGNALPAMPQAGDAASDLEKALDDVADVWLRVNGATPPAGVTVPLNLTLDPTPAVPAPPPYTQANFATDIAALKAAHAALAPALMALNSSRKTRIGLQDQIRPYLVDYREAVPAKLAPNHPLQFSIPRYSPLPGATPEAAELSGSWNVAGVKAFFDFVPSPSASVVRHELRYVAGPDYDADDEVIIASVDAGQPPHLETLTDLGTPGVTASYRLYALTAEGNERTSNTVSITRPV